MASLLSLSLALASLGSAAAFFCDGHMLVAQVALDSGIMTAATVAKVNALVQALNNDYPGTGTTFVESACWADDLKAHATAQEASFHYIDLPICRFSSPQPCPAPESVNTVWAIGAAQSTVFAPASAALDKARQLRLLAHFVGDIHQPLHAATYFSDQFPAGDRGGNSWPVAGFPWTTELHALWDGGLGLWFGDLERPLNATGTAWLADNAQRVLAQFPVASLQPFIKQYNVSEWANQSYALAEGFVYTAPQAPTPVPAAYVAAGQQMILKQVAIAGCRLADLLEYIFTAAATDPAAAFVRLAAPRSRRGE